MKTVKVTTRINAPVDVVWRVLLDFEGHTRWNPFIRSISGQAQPGCRLRIDIAPPGGKGMTFRPRVLVAEPPREFGWLGRFWLPRLFDGEHRFVLTPRSPDSCEFTQSETFRGVLVPFARGLLGGTEAGFQAMNEALRNECERVAATRS